jgi:hypothetical protein
LVWGIPFSFKQDSTISLELNTQTKTLHFFVDCSQLSHCITNINTAPFCFGISGQTSSSFSVEIVSFLLLKKAGVNNNIKCVEYEWGTGRYDKKQ